MMIADNFADVRGLWLTANDTTIYGMVNVDLGKAGHRVAEITRGLGQINTRTHMKTARTIGNISTALVAVLTITTAHSQEKMPGYNTPIPKKIMTPDTVQTRIGTLEFFDGLPSEATAEKVYDFIDLARGVETFLNGIPATSIEGLRLGMIEAGATSYHQVVIFDKLMDSNPLFLTGNTDTVYALAFFDLKKDGPIVVEIPPRCGLGTVDDAFFRFVVDMGGAGTGQGCGRQVPDPSAGLRGRNAQGQA